MRKWLTSGSQKTLCHVRNQERRKGSGVFLCTALFAAFLSSCSSPYGRANKEYDTPRDQLLIRRINEARDEHRHALTLLRNAREPLEKLATLSGGSRTAQALRIQRYAGQCDGVVWEAAKSVASIEDVLRLYFPEPASGKGASASPTWRAACDATLTSMTASSNTMKEAMALLSQETMKLDTIIRDPRAATPAIALGKLDVMVERLAAQVAQADDLALHAVQQVRDARPQAVEP